MSDFQWACPCAGQPPQNTGGIPEGWEVVEYHRVYQWSEGTITRFEPTADWFAELLTGPGSSITGSFNDLTEAMSWCDAQAAEHVKRVMGR